MSGKVVPKSADWQELRYIKHIPLYTGSEQESQRYGETDLWMQSYQENCRCAHTVSEEIKNAYAEHRLNEDCVKSIIGRFGFDRVNRVLANTIQQSPERIRYGSDNAAWASEFYIPEDKFWNERFTVCSHPALVGIFTNIVRREWDMLNLYDADKCYAESMNYTGKIVAISPEVLKDEYKSPEHQLFYVHSTDVGKAYGRFLSDGEEKEFALSEILGVVKLGLIPEWAQARYAETARLCEKEDIVIGGIS